MALTNYYVSIPFRRLLTSDLDKSKFNSGTSSSSSDYIELRMMTDTGSGATGLTRKDVNMALESFEKWLIDGGLLGDGTNLPLEG